METPTLNFAKWLKQEMTSTAAVGGSTSTADIARFSMPIFSDPSRRKFPAKILTDEDKKKK